MLGFVDVAEKPPNSLLIRGGGETARRDFRLSDSCVFLFGISPLLYFVFFFYFYFFQRVRFLGSSSRLRSSLATYGSSILVGGQHVVVLRDVLKE